MNGGVIISKNREKLNWETRFNIIKAYNFTSLQNAGVELLVDTLQTSIPGFSHIKYIKFILLQQKCQNKNSSLGLIIVNF